MLRTSVRSPLLYRRISKRFQSTAVPLSSKAVQNDLELTPKQQTNSSTTTSTNIPPQLPVNVEALYYAPLKNPVTHGHLVADLQLRAYDNENLDFFCDFILRAGYYLGLPMTGPKPLPTRRERWTVIRSPFVHAKSKENFERHTHKRLIRVWDSNPEVVQMLVDYITKNSIAGVGLKCTTYQRTTVDAKSGKISDAIEEINSTHNINSSLKENEEIGAKVVELLNTPTFKKYLEEK